MGQIVQNMRILAAIAMFGVSITLHSQPKLKKIWSSDTTIRTPESVLFDPKEKLLWVSCIDGNSSEKDGKGQIAQLRTNGRIIDKEWITGLNAPKGLARSGNFLYVSDIDELVVIDIGNRKIDKKIPIEGAKFLNDVSVNTSGDVFISDSKTGKIHRYSNGSIQTWMEDLKGPNGILCIKNDVFILASGSLLVAGEDKQVKILCEGLDKSTDGIEQTSSGEFIVSCWSGAIYFVDKSWKANLVLDTRPVKRNTADIGFDPETSTVFVPTFFGNQVEAYTLK